MNDIAVNAPILDAIYCIHRNAANDLPLPLLRFRARQCMESHFPDRRCIHGSGPRQVLTRRLIPERRLMKNTSDGAAVPVRIAWTVFIPDSNFADKCKNSFCELNLTRDNLAT